MSLQDAMTSQRYDELLRKEKEVSDRYPEETDEGKALRAGHMLMGMLLNAHSETEALKQVSSMRLNDAFNPELRALTRYLGERIVSAAGECLPEDVLRLAREWKTCDVERQIDIAGSLFERFLSPSQEGGLMTEENFFKLAFGWMEFQDVSPPKILPKLYGMWGEGGNPNCQGKAQMLTAFGRIAGTDVLCVDPISDSRGIERASFRAILDLILRDVHDRQLHIDAELQRTIDVTMRYIQAETLRPDSYHVAVVLRLRDDRWVLIDPHCLTWGVLSAEWNVSEIARILGKYGDVLPGLNIATHDHGIHERWHADRIRRTKELLERSRLMQIEIESAGSNPAGLIDICKKSPHVEFMMLDAGMPQAFIEEAGREAAAVFTLFGEDLMSPMRFAFDEEFRRKKIGSWLTYFHFTAIDKAGTEHHEMARNGGLMHPVCEFAQPEFNLGLSVVHSMANTNVGNDVILREFMQENSFSQLQLGNSLRGYFYSRAKDERSYVCAAKAEQALRCIPFLHPICTKALELVDSHNLLRRKD